jgi:hypothetical protein
MKHSHRVTLLVGCFASALVLGCGSTSDAFPSAKVTGKVEYNGKALKNGTVVFMLQGQTEKTGAAQIRQDGTYEISDAPIGMNQIMVKAASGGSSAPGGDEKNSNSPYAGVNAPKNAKIPGMPPGTPYNKTAPNIKPDKFPGKYNAVESSGLTFDVKKGNNTYNIELKD